MLKDYGKLLILLMSVTSLVTTATSPRVAPRTAAGVVTAIRQFFRSDCVYFISSGNKEERTTVVQVQKLLARQRAILTKALPYSAINTMAQILRKSCNVPVFVMFSDNSDINAFLREAHNKIALASSVWLLMMMTSAPIDEMFLNAHIPFDTEFLVAQQSPGDVITLTEVYRLAQDRPLEKSAFSTWHAVRGLAPPPSEELYMRRRGLKGLVLKAADVHYPPVSLVYTAGDITELGGFSGEVWKILEHDSNFTTSHVVPTDGGLWGNPRDNGSWDGMINMLLTRQVDVVSSATTMTSMRTDVADFVLPLFTSKFFVYIRKPDHKTVNWSDWLAPFSIRLWVAFLLFTVISAVLMVTLGHLVRRLDGGESRLTLYDQLFLMYGAVICQQGQEKTPNSWSCRILFFVVYITGVVLISSYSGVIISNLTVLRLDLPFNDLEGLLLDGSYALGTLQTTIVDEIFKRADKGLLKDLYTRHIVNDPKNLIKKNEDGFDRVCSTRFAFISNPEAESLWRHEFKCPIVRLPEVFIQYTSSIALPEGSPYLGLFNTKVLKLINDGVLRKIYRAYMGEPDRDVAPGYNSIVLEDVTPMLALIGGGVIGSLLLMGIERLIVGYRVNRVVQDCMGWIVVRLKDFRRRCLGKAVARRGRGRRRWGRGNVFLPYRDKY